MTPNPAHLLLLFLALSAYGRTIGVTPEFWFAGVLMALWAASVVVYELRHEPKERVVVPEGERERFKQRRAEHNAHRNELLRGRK